MKRSAIGLSMLAAVNGILVGCVPRTLDATDPPRQLAQVGVVAARDLRPALAPADGARDARESWRKDEGGALFEITTTATDRHGATFATRLDEDETQYWSFDVEGRPRLHAVDAHDDDATSLFDPPLELAPALLRPDEPFVAKSSMTVVGLGNPARRRDAGTTTRTVRYVGDEELLWRGETVRAAVVEVRFEASLGTAVAEKTTTIEVVPEVGAVRRRSDEVVTILRVFKRTSSTAATRVD